MPARAYFRSVLSLKVSISRGRHERSLLPAPVVGGRRPVTYAYGTAWLLDEIRRRVDRLSTTEHTTLERAGQVGNTHEPKAFAGVTVAEVPASANCSRPLGAFIRRRQHAQ